MTEDLYLEYTNHSINENRKESSNKTAGGLMNRQDSARNIKDKWPMFNLINQRNASQN